MSYPYPPGRAPSILELMFTSPLSGPASGDGGGGYSTTNARPRSTPYHHNYYPSYYMGPDATASPAFILFNDARDVEEAAARQHRRIEEQKSFQHRALQDRQRSAQQQQQHGGGGGAKGQGENKTTTATGTTTTTGNSVSTHQQRPHHAASQQHQAPNWLTLPSFGPYAPPIYIDDVDPFDSLLSTGLGPLASVSGTPLSSSSYSLAAPYLSHSHLSSFSPRIDVHEDGKAFTLTAELPGMPREAVKVNVDDEKRILIVEGEMRMEYDSNKVAADGVKDKGGSDSASTTTTTTTTATTTTTSNSSASASAAAAAKNIKQPAKAAPRHHHITERLYGHFSRSLYLPESAELDRVTASFKDGLLRVVVPKKDQKESDEEKEKEEEVKKRKVTVEEVQE